MKLVAIILFLSFLLPFNVFSQTNKSKRMLRENANKASAHRDFVNTSKKRHQNTPTIALTLKSLKRDYTKKKPTTYSYSPYRRSVSSDVGPKGPEGSPENTSRTDVRNYRKKSPVSVAHNNSRSGKKDYGKKGPFTSAQNTSRSGKKDYGKKGPFTSAQNTSRSPRKDSSRKGPLASSVNSNRKSSPKNWSRN